MDLLVTQIHNFKARREYHTPMNSFYGIIHQTIYQRKSVLTSLQTNRILSNAISFVVLFCVGEREMGFLTFHDVDLKESGCFPVSISRNFY